MKIWRRVLGVTLTLVMSFELLPLALSEREQTGEERLKEERAYSVVQRVEYTPLERYEGYRFLEHCLACEALDLAVLQWTKVEDLESSQREAILSRLKVPEELLGERLAGQTVAHIIACYCDLSEQGVPVTRIVELATDPLALEQGKTVQRAPDSDPAFAPLQSEQKYYGAPFVLEQNGSEQISYTDGSLLVNVTDLTLPGVNGLDLVLSRRYDSSKAKYYGQRGEILHTCGETAQVGYHVTRYFYPQLSNGLLAAQGDYVDEWSIGGRSADSETLAHPMEQHITETDGGFWVDEYQIDNWFCPACQSAATTKHSENSALPEAEGEDVYSLGAGWSLAFSHITTNGEERTLHLADGRDLPVEENGFNGLYWYMSGDLRLEFLEEGYRLTYQDGKVEEFDAEGRLITIRDRFSNAITFSYPADARMKIVDSCGREILLTEQETESGKTLTVSVGGESFSYELTRNTAREIGLPEYNLSAVSDPMGNRTTYHYSDVPAPFSLSGEPDAEGAGMNYVAALTEIEYVTGESTHYEYFTNVLGDFASYGAETDVAVRRRYEGTSDAPQNELLYNYGEDENRPGEVDVTEQIGRRREELGTVEWEPVLYSSVYDPVRNLFTLYEISTKSGLPEYERSFVDGEKVREIYTFYLSYMGGSTPQKVQESVTTYEGTASATRNTYYSYDRKGNLLRAFERMEPGYVGIGSDGQLVLSNTLPDKSYTYDTRYGLVTQILEPTSRGMLTTTNTLSPDGKTVTDTSIQESLSISFVDSNGANQNRALILTRGETSFEYNGQGQLTKKTEQIWQDADDLVEEGIIFPVYIPQSEFVRTAVTEYSYSGGLLTEEKDPGTGMKKTYAYDALGRVISEGDAAGSTAYEYNASGDLVKITYPLGGVDSVQIDYAANTKQVTTRGGAEVLYTYDQSGRILSVYDLTDGVTLTSYGYDGAGRLLWCENAEGASKGRAEYTYDYFDRETLYRMESGTGEELARRTKRYSDALTFGGEDAYSITTTEYGGSSPDVSVTETYNLQGDLLQRNEHGAGTYTYSYDELGNCIAVAGAMSRTYTYNYQNKQTSETIDSQTTNVTRYDSHGNVVAQIGREERRDLSYDSSDRLIAVKYPVNEEENRRGEEYFYNAAGDLTDKVYGYYPSYWPDELMPEPAGATESYSYDAEHNLLSAEGEGSRATVHYTYDAAGNMLTAGGRSYTYDRFSRPLSMTDEQGAVERYEYDANGNLVKTTKRSGTVIESSYNALGLVLSRTGYVQGRAAERETYRYDKRGQMVYESNDAGSWSYRYDAAGRRTGESEGDYTLGLSYDAHGNLTGYKFTQGGEEVYSQTMSYRGEDLSQVRIGDRLVASYEVSDGRLYRRDSLSYGYGIYGQMTSEGSDEFGYDIRGRMTSVERNSRLPRMDRSYTYTNSGELESERDQESGFARSYEYDNRGNRTKLTEGSAVTEYEYDESNRLTEIVRDGVSELCEYDADGNLTKRGARTYEYNAFGKLVRESEGGESWSYSYRPSGARYKKSRTSGGKTETAYNLWLGEKLVGNLNVEKKLWTIYSYGLEKLKQTTYEYTEEFIPETYPGNGEPIIIDGVPQGEWIERIVKDEEDVSEGHLGYTGNTDAFGVQLKEKDGFLTEVSYRGYAYDADTGKYVLPSRYYDPELGRFLQEDSYWGPGNNQRDDSGRVSIQVIYQSVNLYVYCLSDPVNLTDFLGAVAGELFATIDEAAQDWGWNYFGISEYTYFEFGSVIYAVYDNKGNIIGYTYTEAVYGGSDPGQVAYKDAYSMIPENGAPVALIHSHPITHPVYSGRDKDAMAVAKIPMYLVTGNDKGGIMILKREKTSWGYKTYSINDAAPYHRLNVSEQRYWKEQLGNAWKEHLENHEGCALGALINCKDLIWPKHRCTRGTNKIKKKC